MTRRIIIVEDFDEPEADINPILQSLQEQGLKAYLASTDFSPVDTTDNSTTETNSLPELQVANQRLTNEMRRLLNIIDYSGEIMYAVDFGGNITFISNNCLELTGYTSQEIIGKNFLMLFPSTAHPTLVTRLQQQENEQNRGGFITELRNKNGKLIPVEIFGGNYLENGVPVLNVGRVHNISERVEMEAQILQHNEELQRTNLHLEQATRHKSDFMANMSHELRTPLNAIIGFSELLYDQVFGTLNEKQARYVNNILSSGRNLLVLVNDILDLAKVEAGKMELQTETFVIQELINQVFNVFLPLALKKNITLACQVHPNWQNIIITADRGKIQQILNNLLSNALKFTDAGGAIEIGTRLATRQDSPCLEINVRDTGIGIPLEDQQRIFEEFQMLDNTLSRRQQGTGLGLALSRQLATLHHGSLEVESEPGKGSTFTLQLPLEPAPASSGLGENDPTSLWEAEGDDLAVMPKLALVIEDEDKSAELLQLYLQQSGYRVIRTSNSIEALAAARQYMPGVITLDLMLPGKSGWDILKELKADPQTASIPVIVISMLDEVLDLAELNLAAVFVKPLRKEKLAAKLAELEQTNPPGVNRPDNSKLHALVIDDSTNDRELISTALQTAGLEVATAPDGERGWQQAVLNPPDLVILDLIMPGLTGFDLLTRLHQHQSTINVPVFIFTAKELNEAEREALKPAAGIFSKSDFAQNKLQSKLLEAVYHLAGKHRLN